jgi:cold shock CspA family protein
VEQKIKDGDEVIFELQEGKKGINAVKVKLAE